MIVDGRAIAARIYREIQNEVTHMRSKPHLTVFTCNPNFETQKYLALKRRKAHEVGISMSVVEFPLAITTEEIVTSIKHSCMQTDGIIVQLPFPNHIEIDTVLKAIPKAYDVDAVSYDGSDETILPPVVGAIREISLIHDILFASQKVIVVGKGRLVGMPSEIWCQTQGAQVTVVTKETQNSEEIIKAAHIIILGAGQPNLLVPDMMSKGAVIFDAGTTEDGGVLVGDADPACAEKASVFTPVPGGIGPITVAILLRNLVTLASVQ